MILAGNQPYFIPYIGYWQLMKAADVYVIADDAQYMRHAWVNRNRILTNKTSQTLFTLELVKASHAEPINHRYISEQYNAEKKLSVLRNAYGKAPYFQEGMALMTQILNCPERNLAQYLLHSIGCIRDYLGITTPMYRQSELNLNPEHRCEEMVYEVCHKLGADTYYNAIGGQALYSKEEFAKQGINLGFLQTGDIRYRQFGDGFIPSLSILDVMMFNSKEAIQEMLNHYTIV